MTGGRAEGAELGRDVALEVLRTGRAADDESRRRFEQEARAVAALAHPNIVTVFDVGSDGDTTYLVTGILEGETLRQRLQRGPLPAGEVVLLRGLPQRMADFP